MISSSAIKSTETRIDSTPGNSTTKAHIDPYFLRPDHIPNTKRTSVSSDGDQSPSKRQKARESRDNAKQSTPPPLPEAGEKRSSGRVRLKAEQPNYVSIEDATREGIFGSPTPTPAPGNKTKRRPRPSLVNRLKVLADPVEDNTDWSPPLSPEVPKTDENSTLDRGREQQRPNISSGIEEMRNASEEPSLPILQPSTSQTASFKITFVVKGHGSRNEYEIWRPEGGRFLDKSLEQVIQELPKRRLAADVTGIVFSICMADDNDNSPPKWTIGRNDEDGFQFVKKKFSREISAALKQKTTRPLLFEMEIEPLYSLEEKYEDEAIFDASDNISF